MPFEVEKFHRIVVEVMWYALRRDTELLQEELEEDPD